MARCSFLIRATRARYRARSDVIFGSQEAGAVIRKLMRATPETSATVLRHIPPRTTDSGPRAFPEPKTEPFSEAIRPRVAAPR